jgi:hypothetical protein
MALIVNGSAFWLYRATNAQWLGNSANSAESFGSAPYQHFVDFDLLGSKFIVVFGGNLASSGMSAPGETWNLRIGGSFATGAPSQPIDGDLVTIGITGAVGAFETFTLVSPEIDNIWTGVQLVKLSGSVPGGGAFAQRPTILFYPVAS